MSTVALDDYVLGAVLAEVAPIAEPDHAIVAIFDVQAIVARSYAASHIGRHHAEGFDLCDSTHCQLYDPERSRTSRFAPPARQAVLRTRGHVLVYGPHLVEALFHADCGGATAPADAVWGGRAVPYLPGVIDDIGGETHRAWRLSLSLDGLRQALNEDARTTVGRRLDGVDVLSRDTSGRAAELGVRGERSYTVRGDAFRAVVNRMLGDRAMLSTRFELAHESDQLVFTGTGFGHGVGLCQRGAAARARRGDTAHAILGAYFPGATVSAVQSGPRPRP